MTTRRKHLGIPAAIVAALVGIAAAPAGSVAARTAFAARALKARDTARLHYTAAVGSLLYEQGEASGTLPGTMHVKFDVASTFTGSFTIYTRAGTIGGHGTATPHGSGVYESFAGSIVVTGGSGRYAHAHGHAGLYGTFDRETYGLLVQTTGTLIY
jgi:hypothetical protein